MSEGLDFEILRDEWRNGLIQEIVPISRDEVDEKVRYMMSNVAEHRLTPQRFLCSKGGREAPIVVPTTGVYHARSIITDIVYPSTVHITSAQPFGGNPRITYRFKPIDNG